MCFDCFYWSLLMHLPSRCLSGAEKRFLLCKDWKKAELYQVHTSVVFGPQMFFRHKWLNLDTVSLRFLSLMIIVASFVEVLFFLSLRHVLGWWFFVMLCYGNFCIWKEKLIWPRMGWLCFFGGLRFFVTFMWVWAKFSENLLKYVSVLVTKRCFRCLFWGAFWSAV